MYVCGLEEFTLVDVVTLLYKDEVTRGMEITLVFIQSHE